MRRLRSGRCWVSKSTRGIIAGPVEAGLEHTQPRAIVREVWRRSGLAFETSAPAARDEGLALRAGSVGGQTVVLNPVAVARDHSLTAAPTRRVLEVSDTARQVASIDVAEAFFPAYRCGALQHRWRRVCRVRHPVVLMKRGHVPRN